MRDVTLCFFLLAATALAQLPPAAARRIDFRNDIEPVLRASCIGCHGAAAQQSGFRLDDRASLLKGGNSGKPAVLPGNSEGSLLIQRVAGCLGIDHTRLTYRYLGRDFRLTDVGGKVVNKLLA